MTTPVTGTNRPTTGDAHYQRPGVLTRRVMNPVVALLTRRGLSIWGSRVLEVPGRTSGQLRSTPVNLLVLDGERYLVAARGTTEWVRNVRAAGQVTLRLGRRAEVVALQELAHHDKEPVLRAYLRRWKAEVGAFFDGVDADSSADDLARVAVRHPVFRLVAVPPERPVADS